MPQHETCAFHTLTVAEILVTISHNCSEYNVYLLHIYSFLTVSYKLNICPYLFKNSLNILVENHYLFVLLRVCLEIELSFQTFAVITFSSFNRFIQKST